MGAAASSGNNNGGPGTGKREGGGLANWVIYGPVLGCIFLISLCLLYDKINNYLMSRRHDNSHVAKRRYPRGSNPKEKEEKEEKKEMYPTEKAERSEDDVRYTDANTRDTAAGFFLPVESFGRKVMQRVPSDTMEFFKMQEPTEDQRIPSMDRERILLNQQRRSLDMQQRFMLDQQRFMLNQQMPKFDQRNPALDQQSPSCDQQSPSCDQQSPSCDQQSPSCNQQSPTYAQQSRTCDQQLPSWDQQRLWEDKIAVLDQKIAILEQNKPKEKYSCVKKKISLDVSRIESPGSSREEVRRPLLSSNSDSIVCSSDRGVGLDQEASLSEQQVPLLDQRILLEMKSQEPQISSVRPSLLSSKSLDI